jgi:hypothetical protein
VTESELVDLLQSRNGCPTLITLWDGEPMQIEDISEAELDPVPLEMASFSETGGIPVSADRGRYFFYSTEIGRVEDVSTGAILFARSRP